MFNTQSFDMDVNKRRLQYFSLLLVFLLSACGSDSPGNSNSQPIAFAGYDQSVSKNTLVILQGTGTDDDGDSLTYQWTQVTGTTVVLSNPLTQTPEFYAPNLTGDLVFSLVVGDGIVNSVSDEVTITIINSTPIISDVVLTPSPAYTDTNLSISVSGSDPDDDALSNTYSWSVNGALLPGETGSTLASTNYVKFDEVSVTVALTDGVAVVNSNISLMIQDAPPVVNVIGAPTTADYGIPVNFQAIASDPDGDVINVDFAYRPNGMQIDSLGNVTWTPGGPLFEKSTDFNWSVSVVSGTTSVQNFGGTIQVTDVARQTPLVRSGIEVPKNNEGIRIGDFDNDGSVEILVTDSNKRLFTMAYDGVGYSQTWFYPFNLASGESRIQSLATKDIDGDNRHEIFVGTSAFYTGSSITQILVLDGITREVVRSVDINAEQIMAMRIVDVDGDNTPELISIISDDSGYDSRRIEVRDATNLSLEWQSDVLLFGDSLAVGNVDIDAGIEIVTAGGYVYGYDGSTYVNEWAYGVDFGFDVEIGDLDADGVSEIIGAVDWTAVRIYSAVTKVMLTEILESDLDDINVGDIDSDGKAEILVGNGQRGNITAYSYTSLPVPALAQDWAISSQSNGVTSLVYGDVDNDAGIEFIWGTGVGSSGEDSLVIAGLNPSIAVEWQNITPSQLDGPFVGGEWFTLGAADKRLLFATAETDNGYAGSRLISMDAVSGQLNLTSDLGRNSNRVIAFAGADYDADSVDELFVATSDFYSPFTTYDFVGDLAEWTSPTITGTGIAVVQGDMNNDTFADFITLTSTGHLYVFDPLNSVLLWSTQYGIYGIWDKDIEVKDLNNDGVLEIISAASGTINIYSKIVTTYELMASVSLVDMDIVDITVGDLDADGVPEIVAGTQSYTGPSVVYTFNTDLSVKSSFTLIDKHLEGVTIEEFGTGFKNLLLSISPGTYGTPALGYFEVVSPETGGAIMRSPELIGSPSLNSVHYVDTDSNGTPEISYGTNYTVNKTR